MYVETYTSATQTILLNPATQLPAAGPGADLAAATASFFRDLLVSLQSDPALHDRQVRAVACTVTAPVQRWRYEPLWLALPYAAALGATALALLAGAHGFARNGYAADARFSTFVATSRSADLDALSRGACLGRWPTPPRLRDARLRFGEIVGGGDGDGAGPARGGGPEGGEGEEKEEQRPHAAFAFEASVRDFDRRKQYVPKADSG